MDKQILVDEELHTLLKIRASKNKRSIKEEVTELLKEAMEDKFKNTTNKEM